MKSISKHMMVLLLSLILVVPVGLMAKTKLRIQELEEIRQEISLLNLLRGLYLSRDQATQIFALAQKAHDLRDGVEKNFLTDEKTILSTFSDLREALYLEPGREKNAQDKAVTLEGRIKDAMGKVGDQISDMEKDAEKILSSGQVAILEDFRPCLVPPRDLRNPVRVGQASADGGHLGKIADLIYAAPADLWMNRRDGLFEKLSQRLQGEVGIMNADMKADLRKRLETISEKIRACPEVDYTLKRDELSSELMLINPKKALKQGHKKIGDIGKWLLSETAFEVLPKWIKGMDKIPATVPGETEDDLPPDISVTEQGAKALMAIKRMYNQRLGAQNLPTLEALNGPIKAAADKNDKKVLAEKALAALDQLAAVKIDPPMVKAMAQMARITARGTGLPLLNPEHDPYGLAAELKGFLDSSDPAAAVRGIRGLIDTLRKFKTVR